ncbi:LexA family transcriptional regulator [Desulfovibrio inopinatus]|uniref:LexA family transcriptional regulator n=1 Tax=Desulfovibrio inopinatus TaxID=102109 RepID=UPI0004893F2E|nr:helix-turn-helix domain-containing protein [Desulfovibrio inopinatus]
MDQAYFDDAFGRIKNATGAKSQMEVAVLLDIQQSSISDAKRRNSIPAEWLLKLLSRHGLNPEWIQSGKKPMYLYETEEGRIGLQSPRAVSPKRLASTSVVVYSMAGEIGEGERWTGAPLEIIPLPEDFHIPGLVCVKMDGSGMEPLIPREAYVGIDTGQRRIVSGEFFAVALPPEGLVIRRVFFETTDGRLVLRAENPDYHCQYLAVSKIEHHLVGRVSWVLRRM